jgi:hypothetical protein
MFNPRGLAILFTLVAALHLLPIWRVQYVPTVDGPAHVYNAMVLRELAQGAPAFSRVFFADLRPHPNWLTHLMLMAMPEKVVVGAIVLLFLFGCWRLAGAVDPGSRVYAFLAMPLAYHLLFQMGFYNYSLGVALVPWALASWWRRRDETSGRTIAVIAAWLVVLYFAHVIAAVAAAGFLLIGIVLRRQWRHGLAFAPLALLLLWFFLQPKPPGGTWTWEGALLWTPLLKTALLLTFDLRQLTWGTALAVAFAVLIVLTLILEKRGERDVFLVLAVLAVVAYLAAPISVQEALVLKARLLIFPYLVILPWLTPRIPRWPLAIVLALAAAANVFFIRDAWKRNDKLIAAAVEPLKAATPHRTIVPLVFDRSSPHSTLPLLSHAVANGAAERKLVDLGNYEAGLPFFPVQFRAGVQRPPIISIETAPGDYDPNAWADAVEYVYTWKMPADAPLAARLLERYDLAAEHGQARLYARR